MILITLSISISQEVWALISQNGWRAKTAEITEDRIHEYLSSEGFTAVHTSMGWKVNPTYQKNQMHGYLLIHRTVEDHILGHHVDNLVAIIPSRIETAAQVLGIKRAKLGIQTDSTFTIYTRR